MYNASDAHHYSDYASITTMLLFSVISLLSIPCH